MKKSQITAILICSLLLCFCFTGVAYADVWEFGTGGAEAYPFLPKGYMIVTEDGEYWLSSRFRNTVGGTLYTGTLNGLSYIDAAKPDGSTHILYALTDRNPEEYKYLVAYKDGVMIEDFSSYIGVPGRVEDEDYMGSNANWKIPVIGFRFEPGTYYEFAFLRGLRAKNGVSLVLSEDGMGYLRTPFTSEESARYEAQKNKEYEFVTSYWKIDRGNGDYSWGYNLVPMRFSIQTYADLTTWKTVADEAQAFLDSVTPADISGGKYVQSNLNNLKLLIEEQRQEAESTVKRQLQPKAEESMERMVLELRFALEQAKSSQEMIADTSILEELLHDAKILYDKASVNTGTQLGQYSETRVRELKDVIDYAETLTQTSPQVVINKAVKELRDAMIRVLNSLIRTPTVVLTDEATGVRVILPRGSVPEDTILYVNINEGNIPQAGALRTHFGDKFEEILFYEIRLSRPSGEGDRTVRPTEGMEVQIPESRNISGKSVSVYFACDAAEPARISSVASGGYRVFSANEAGLFVLAVRASTAGLSGNSEGKNDGETVTVTVVKDTETDLDKDPDKSWEELDEEKGPVKELAEIDFGEEWARHDVLASVDIPFGDLRRNGNPAPLVLLAAALTALAVALLVPELVKNARRRGKSA
ncbi:MAG: hypothetical protein FWD39_01660 [Clostridiales bacterium]|nr:hypothetical protein [Clostridiales bacterium]